MAMHVSKHAETQMRACRQSRRPAIPRAIYTPNSGIKRRSDSKDPARRMRIKRFTLKSEMYTEAPLCSLFIVDVWG
ncbi:hypothetical protein TNCT_618001 [Trichonephila clavata]|uniref:Uncharacterized protein n=1 Tax=Trichonephila clavata TaxID=2740835 RepID=A0A8X6HB63_TRICU|nr:hypothetical protein TNCT_618001 [Trichonephila clavata]